VRPLPLLDRHAGPLRVLCLGAHCDDIEIGCGATLLRLLAERPNVSVHWVVFSGSDERREETRRSAVDFLADAYEKRLTLLPFRESFFPYQGEAIKAEFERLKGTEPDIVFTHYKSDHHQDHRVVADLTWNTFRDHAILEYEVVKWESDLGHPNLFVPVSRDTGLRKARTLLTHYATQAVRPWFSEETFLSMLRLRGIGCAAPEGYAEAFHCRKVVV
jgi:LmbE family N-acetylglucosaminyl deacetylase